MIIQSFPSGPFETNAYVVSCQQTKSCAIIDPAPDSEKSIIQYINHHQLLPKMILLTHSHWDHIADVSKLKKVLPVPVYVHEQDAPNLKNPGTDGLPNFQTIEGVTPDHFLTEKEPIKLGSISFSVIHTPGHTPGGVCFYSKEEEVLFSGDTLFKRSIGNLSLPTANEEDMWVSLEKLAKLPPSTHVYPGHGPSTTIGSETWLDNAKKIFGGH